MTVCKYFLQGNCRFGKNCKFEHTRQGQGNQYQWVNPSQTRNSGNAGFGGGGGGYRNQNRFQALSDSQAGSDDNVLRVISQDVNEWMQCKQWPLSCYGPKDTSVCISGLEDVSPEELRFEFRQLSTVTNNLEGYGRKVMELVAKLGRRKEELKAPTGSVKDALMQELLNPGSNASKSTPGGFGNTPGAFGNTQSANSTQGAFGNAQGDSTQGAFGNTGGLFNQAPSNNVFGASQGNANLFQNKNVFANTAGTNPTPSNLFGGGGAQPSSVFGSAAAGSSNLFGQSANTGLFGKPATTNLFDKDMSTNLFGKDASSNSFGKDANTNLFGKPANSNLFGKTDAQTSRGGNPFQNSNSAFGSSANNVPAPSVFGTNAQSAQPSGATGANNSTHDKLFTPMDQLTDAEKEQFQTQKFTLGKIPIRPPPKEFVS